MKKLLIGLLAILTLTTYGQENKFEQRAHKKELCEKRPDLSPKQMAELTTKKMTLHLDLSKTQQEEINKIELERAKKRKEQHENRENRKNLTDAERFDRKNEMLDVQIAHKKKMKSILTEEQYKKWQSERHLKKDGRHKKEKNRTRQ